MVTKLELYNKALTHLGPTRLLADNENRPDRHELDAVYQGTLKAMLERGLWYFALRSSMLLPDNDVEPRFGRQCAYRLPEDYVRLRAICVDERQEIEDRSFRRERDVIYSDQSRLFMSYVSDDVNYGRNLGAFTELFAEAMAAELAYQSGLPITKDRGTKNDLLIIKKQALFDAKRLEAVDERVKFRPVGSWATSRIPRSSASLQRRERFQ